MKKFKVSKIQWDTDGYKVKLPKTAIVEAEDEDEAINILSDEYGWLIRGCYIKEVTE